MPLKIYDAQDAVPEDERDEYVEHEGKWHPKAVIELASERTKRAQLLSEKKEADRLRKEAEAESERLKKAKDATDKGVSEEALQKIRNDEAEARKPIEKERDRLLAENLKLKRDDKVRALYLNHDGMSDRVEDAMDQLLKRTELGDADGIVFKDEKGQVTADDAATFFKKFRTAKPWLFKGSGASGSGAEGSNGSGGGGGGTITPKEALDQKRSELQGAL
jgi:hypothetical protein